MYHLIFWCFWTVRVTAQWESFHIPLPITLLIRINSPHKTMPNRFCWAQKQITAIFLRRAMCRDANDQVKYITHHEGECRGWWMAALCGIKWQAVGQIVGCQRFTGLHAMNVLALTHGYSIVDICWLRIFLMNHDQERICKGDCLQHRYHVYFSVFPHALF